MNAVAFDTLKTARALETSGIPRAHAEAIAEQLAEGRTVDLSHLATKDELKAELKYLASKADIAELKADMLKVIIGAVALNTAIVVGAVLGVAKLLGH
jgi:hypothetical protein